MTDHDGRTILKGLIQTLRDAPTTTIILSTSIGT